MKNFFRFLLILIVAILVYIYNNPEVIDKYKNDVTDLLEPDSTVSVEKNEIEDVKDSVPVVEEKVVETNKSKSKKPIVRDKNTIDTAAINALKCHFILEKYNNADFYIPKCALDVNGKRYSNQRRFYVYVGVFNNRQVFTNLSLDMTVIDSVQLNITKLSISADGDMYEILEKPTSVGRGYKGGFSAAYEIDLSNYVNMAWALYYADSAKVVYESNGVKKEMAITSEELQYIRYSMDFYRSWIRCPKCVF